MASRPITWVNTAVLLQAIDRYERGMLPRSLQLWLETVLDLERPLKGSLRPRC